MRQTTTATCPRCQCPFGQNMIDRDGDPRFHCPVCGHHISYQANGAGAIKATIETYGAYMITRRNGPIQSGGFSVPITTDLIAHFDEILKDPEVLPRQCYMTAWTGQGVLFIAGTFLQPLLPMHITTYSKN